MTTKYMHTIDGRPAAFQARYNSIYFLSKHQQAAPLADSLRQIRREQKIDGDNRKNIMGGDYGPGDYGPGDYGYVKVKT